MKPLPIFTLLLIPWCVVAQTADDASWAMTHVSVVDVANGRIDTDQTVYVRGGRIATVGASTDTSLDERVRQIDGAGLFVLPGLWDMHAHLFFGEEGLREIAAARYLAQGVLAVRDPGAPLDRIAALARDENAVRPAIWFAGPILNGPCIPPLPVYLTVSDAAEAGPAVTTLAEGGVHFIKVHDWLSRPAYDAVVAAARERKLPVIGHIPFAVGIDGAIIAGQKTVEHFGGLTHPLLRACAQPKHALEQELQRRGAEMAKFPALQFAMSSAYLTSLLETFNADECRVLADRMARAKMGQVPTLVLWRLWANATDLPGTAEDRVARQRLFSTYQQIVAIMHQAGVPILAGTDEIPNSTIHDEMELLVDAGLPPVAALRAATIRAAEFVGAADSHGVIAPGRLANFIVIEGDPLVDIRNTRRIRSVALHGRYHDRGAVARWLQPETAK